VKAKVDNVKAKIDIVKAKIDNVMIKDSGQGGEGTLVKTHTCKMSSLWPVGCISD
jgi:hypothetical protein